MQKLAELCVKRPVFASVLVLTLVVIGYRLFFPEAFPPAAVGWASLMVALLLLGGIQMVFFGILGEYTGQTYLRVNNKPQAAIREVINREPTEQPRMARQEVSLGNQSDL